MTHTFLVSDENVNEYGYRILTAGIDTNQYERNPVVLYLHERARNPNQVVGRALKLYKKDNQLFAEIEFDEEDKYAKKLAGKVERGYIKMCSIYADVIETSLDEALMLPGQSHETVTKCKLVEISIVDIGGNDNALKLSRNGEPVQLRKIEQKTNTDMSLKTIALSLGLDENVSEAVIKTKIEKITLAKNNAEAAKKVLENKIKDIEVKADEVLVDSAIELGLIDEAFKQGTLKALEHDREEQTVVLTKMIADAKAEDIIDATHKAVKEVVLGSKKGTPGPSAADQECFDYLQKHDVAKLSKIREEDPKKYAQLTKAFGEGKRYTPNN
ncbi:MAG: HK97 family phage prohead protease [Psychroserpens sp.]|uniref:HK97 family phage prohead protease n=1 Tax=Psychroserpens sp. TaxID=2020870 RepID=UPI003C7EF45D